MKGLTTKEVSGWKQCNRRQALLGDLIYSKKKFFLRSCIHRQGHKSNLFPKNHPQPPARLPKIS